MRAASRTVIAILAALLLLSTACKESTKTHLKVNDKGLAIKMSFVTGERSKDSNSQRYSLTVDGETVTYGGPHPPCQRGRCAHGEVDFALDKRVYDEALAAIQRGDLAREFSEEKPIGSLGNYVTVEATVTLGSKTGKTVVKGMSFSNEDGDVLTEEARSRAEAVRMVLIPFRSEGEERLPKE